ncbi:hypothetical protein [Winogradskyella sp.]|uniref:hypothetical protein n=1 Tax=Winogradskyella sp. TaxID=1883156 RepID=UPI0025D99E56|nr:hypothetical protein [Winogradskyella sp.]
MKRSLVIIVLLVLSCSTSQLVDSWKSPDIDTYSPSKVLIVGLTPNIVAKQKFEDQLKEQLEMRGIEAITSMDFFKPSFKTEKLTEAELKILENDLIRDGFDTVLFSKVIGVEDKIAYSKNFDVYDKTFIRFKDDYLRYQDVFYNPDYYEEYTVYNAETSMFCICPSKDRELIWKGYIDIVDPQSIDTTVSDYVKLVVTVLEEQQLISPRILEAIERPIE